MKNVSKTNINLESLRGGAAAFVVFGHFISINQGMNGYLPKPLKFFFSLDIAHFSVLLFFILSGYVIGITNKTSLTWQTSLGYLKKRMLRLYPIYLICVLFALLVAVEHYDKITILSNLLILQGGYKQLISEIGTIWSLHYEVLYYLLFIPISIYNIKPLHAFAGSIALALIFNHSFNNYPILTSYFWGFSFWTTGLCIGRYCHTKQDVRPARMIGALVYCLCLPPLMEALLGNEKVEGFLNKIASFPPNAYWPTVTIPLKDMVYLPYCFSIFMLFAGHVYRYQKQVVLLLQLPLVFCIVNTFRGGYISPAFMVCCLYFFLAVALYTVHWDSLKVVNSLFARIINTGAWLGSISYGIYLIHYPLIMLMGKYPILQAQTVVPYFVKMAVCMVLVVFIGFVLEKKYQPWAKQKLQDAPLFKAWLAVIKKSLAHLDKALQGAKLAFSNMQDVKKQME